MKKICWLSLLCAATSCVLGTEVGSDSGTSPDGGSTDAGVVDSGHSDSGSPDSGLADSGAPDSGRLDSGAPDAGGSDSGVSDSGAPDSGTSDAGRTDSGTTTDGGSPGDAGSDSGYGAVVNENLETVTLYVDAVAGSDSNPGTAQLPFATVDAGIRAAEANNLKSIGTRIEVRPGTYREAVAWGPAAGETSLPITLEAENAGAVIMSGADVWTGWTPSSTNSQVYIHPWPYQWGTATSIKGWPPTEEILLRREMLFVNGVQLTQVLDPAQMLVGTFYVDDLVAGAGTVSIWPPPGTNVASATIEVPTRTTVLTLAKKSNAVVRGITFQYSNPFIQTGTPVAVSGASNVLFDRDVFQYFNGAGMEVTGSTFTTVQNCVAQHNGMAGLTSYHVQYALWQNDTVAYNNWRGLQNAYYGWGDNGADFFLTHESAFLGMQAFYNGCNGIHFDTDNAVITMQGLVSAGNLSSGLLVEADEGPFDVSGATVCNNNPTGGFGSGVWLNDSWYVTLSNDAIFGNGYTQLLASDNGRAGTNWEDGGVYPLRGSDFVTLRSDTLVGTTNAQLGFRARPVIPWATFTSNFVSTGNDWWNASNTSFFFDPDQVTAVNLSTWQTQSGQDATSTFSAPSPAPTCTLPSPDVPDFIVHLDVHDGQSKVINAAGGSAVFQIDLLSVGLSGTVNLSVAGLPAGATGTFASPSVALPGNTTLTVSTTAATPLGTVPMTVLATNGTLTRTATVPLQIGLPVKLKWASGPTTLAVSQCGIYQLISADQNGNPADVTANTTIVLSGLGSGQFYQEATCSVPVGAVVINAGQDAPGFSGTHSIWFKDPVAESLSIVAATSNGSLLPATLSVTVK